MAGAAQRSCSQATPNPSRSPSRPVPSPPPPTTPIEYPHYLSPRMLSLLLAPSPSSCLYSQLLSPSHSISPRCFLPLPPSRCLSFYTILSLPPSSYSPPYLHLPLLFPIPTSPCFSPPLFPSPSLSYFFLPPPSTPCSLLRVPACLPACLPFPPPFPSPSLPLLIISWSAYLPKSLNLDLLSPCPPMASLSSHSPSSLCRPSLPSPF